jgi:hypothetical protein
MRDTAAARTVLYKVSIATVSRYFFEKTITVASIRFTSPQLPAIHRAQFLLDHIELSEAQFGFGS